MSKSPVERLLDSVDWKPVEPPAELEGSIPYATHSGILNIGGCELECVVLNTGERLITEEGLRKLFGDGWDDLMEAASHIRGEKRNSPRTNTGPSATTWRERYGW